MDLPTLLNTTSRAISQTQESDPILFVAVIFTAGFFLGILTKWGGKLIIKLFLIILFLALAVFLFTTGALSGLIGFVLFVLFIVLYLIKKVLIG